ncbi:hypothetical protein V8F33_011329 [Rhypophila sp. PSN 637]
MSSPSYASSSQDERNPVDTLLCEGINDDIFNNCIDMEWHNRDHVLIPFPRSEVDKFTTPFPIQEEGGSRSTLGTLERLPLEINTMIVNSMDLASVIRFMHTNRAARALVQQAPEFRLVTQHAGDSAFLAALATRVSHFVSLPEIQLALTTYKCTYCTNFAEFVFLPTMERGCGYCLRRWKQFEVREIKLASRPAGIKPKQPVLAGKSALWIQEKATKVYMQLPLRLAYRGPRHKWQFHMIRIFPSPMQDSILGPDLVYETNAELTDYDTDMWTVCRVPAVENPWGLHETGPGPEEPRYKSGLLAAIPVPYLKDRSTGALVREGVRCAGGCREKRILMPTTYLEEHFPQCRGAKKLFLEYRDERGLNDGGVVIDGEYMSSSDESEDEEEGEEEEDEENGEEDEDEESGEESEEHSDSEWDERDEEMEP